LKIKQLNYDFYYQRWFLFTKRDESQKQVIFITDHKDDLTSDINKPNIVNFNFANYDVWSFSNKEKKECLNFWVY